MHQHKNNLFALGVDHAIFHACHEWCVYVQGMFNLVIAFPNIGQVFERLVEVRLWFQNLTTMQVTHRLQQIAFLGAGLPVTE